MACVTSHATAEEGKDKPADIYADVKEEEVTVDSSNYDEQVCGCGCVHTCMCIVCMCLRMHAHKSVVLLVRMCLKSG